MCQSFNEQYNLNYKCLMPTNTFGPNDNYDDKILIFLPALIKKFITQKYKKKQIKFMGKWKT